MPLLWLAKGCLAFGDATLLDHCELQIECGERIALIGRNGSGKSSLLAALCGQIKLDDGEIWRAPGLNMAHVVQEPQFGSSQTTLEVVEAGVNEAAVRYKELADRLAEAEQVGDLLLKEELNEGLLHCQQQLEHAGWNSQARAERALSRFALSADTDVATLSGGQQKRLALAAAVVREPQLLLLDEPTNHLDISAIAWLEKWLLNSGLSLLFVTHDRAFLACVATRIIELDRGRLQSFPGTFSDYQKKKEADLHAERRANERNDRLLAIEERWIRKGVEARRTSAAFRIQRLQKLRAARSERRQRMGEARLRFDSGQTSGKLVAELQCASLAYGEKTIVRDLSTRILRGDKVGLIGDNGIGKTTLLKLLLGQLKPDSGKLLPGTNLQFAYFDQMRSKLDPEARLVDMISPGSDTVHIAGRSRHVIGYLEDFLFAPQQSRAKVRSLSGGEKNRLLLARLFARPANVLVMDEPTNDLDVETLELLEALLQDYDGTLFLVSHDRCFLDNVVTQTLAAQGDGRWQENVGGYTDWQRIKKRQSSQDAKQAGRQNAAPAGDQAASKSKSTRSGKLSYNENRELASLPQRIEMLENEQAELAEHLQDPGAYASSAEKARHLADRLAQIDLELTSLLARWEALELKASHPAR